MVDLRFSGPRYTLSNKWHGAALIREQFDRSIANTDWRLLFPRATITHFSCIGSDYGAIILDTFGDQNCGLRPFTFEPFWVSKASCHMVVEDT